MVVLSAAIAEVHFCSMQSTSPKPLQVVYLIKADGFVQHPALGMTGVKKFRDKKLMVHDNFWTEPTFTVERRVIAHEWYQKGNRKIRQNIPLHTLEAEGIPQKLGKKHFEAYLKAKEFMRREKDRVIQRTFHNE